MYINELEAGESITVEAYDEDKRIMLSSTIISITEEEQAYLQKLAASANIKGFTVMEVIHEGDYAVNFQSPTVTCNATALKDGKPYSWEKVKIFRVRLPQTGYSQVVFSNVDAKMFNRRHEYRLGLHCEASCRVGEDTAVRTVTIKDISEHGVGLIADDSIEINAGDVLDIQFREGAERTSTLFRIKAKVLHVYPTNNKQNNVGCILLQHDDSLTKFIYRTQRTRMKTKK